MRPRLAAALAALCVVLAGCAFSSATPRPAQFDDLEASLAKVHDTGKPVSLKTLTPFEWDRVYLCSGYLDGRYVNDAIGLDIFSDDEEVTTENFAMFIFMRKGAPVRMSQVNVGTAHVSYQDAIEEWPDDVVFGPIADPSGWSWGFTSASAPPSPTATPAAS